MIELTYDDAILVAGGLVFMGWVVGVMTDGWIDRMYGIRDSWWGRRKENV